MIEEKLDIKEMIYEIRGKQVMLDSDLAKLYHCKNGTKEINQAVKNNIEKFPERFSWILTEEELKNLQSKFLTTNYSNMSRSLPRVFTEHGIYMLATIIKSSKATEISIRIMDTFVAMRHYIGTNEYRLLTIESKLLEHDKEIKELQEAFDNFNKEEDEMYLNNIWKAYSKVLDIFMKGKNELIIIDRFTDKTFLDMASRLKCNIILITSKKTKITNLDLEKYNKTYNNLKIIYNDTYHDRYFIIDRCEVYFSGNSINHIGERKSTISLMKDIKVKNAILKDILKIIN